MNFGTFRQRNGTMKNDGVARGAGKTSRRIHARVGCRVVGDDRARGEGERKCPGGGTIQVLRNGGSCTNDTEFVETFSMIHIFFVHSGSMV